jgi:hypothetical protein
MLFSLLRLSREVEGDLVGIQKLVDDYIDAHRSVNAGFGKSLRGDTLKRYAKKVVRADRLVIVVLAALIAAFFVHGMLPDVQKHNDVVSADLMAGFIVYALYRVKCYSEKSFWIPVKFKLFQLVNWKWW